MEDDSISNSMSFCLPPNHVNFLECNLVRFLKLGRAAAGGSEKHWCWHAICHVAFTQLALCEQFISCIHDVLCNRGEQHQEVF